jgi:hypothetical protein
MRLDFGTPFITVELEHNMQSELNFAVVHRVSKLQFHSDSVNIVANRGSFR